MSKILIDSESEECLCMNYTTFQEAMKQEGLPLEVDALSVYRAFEQVQDGRHKRGEYDTAWL
jgi:hypothetical protein